MKKYERYFHVNIVVFECKKKESEGHMIKKIFSLAQTREEKQEVERLVQELELEVVQEQSEDELMFQFDETGLSLVRNDLALRGDFLKILPRLKQSNLNAELLVRAAKVKESKGDLTAIDATAGLGEDALLLAAAGFTVDLFEYNPMIAALLRDTLRRAAEVPELQEIVARMHLKQGDSIIEMSKLKGQHSVILLDPMFPARQKSGAVKKKFQLLKYLEQPCFMEEELMEAAIQAQPFKIIVKRPAKAPHLAGRKPTNAIIGKGIRYDCIVLR